MFILRTQAVINLNNVFEIAEADSITDNEHSLAIVAPDGIHFVKAIVKKRAGFFCKLDTIFIISVYIELSPF